MGSSIRSIAKATGLSVATVSRALRCLPVVSPELRQKVEECASKLGYRSSPLVGAVLSSVRRQNQASFVGNLAVVALRRSEAAALLPFQQRQLEGAKAKALALGFSLGTHYFTPGETKLASLQRILRSRGVKGLVFLNSNETTDLSRFEWKGIAAVQIDYPLSAPPLTTVGIDHHRTLGSALRMVSERGYRKVGFFIERPKDARLAYKWSGAFLGHQNGDSNIGALPLLEHEKLDKKEFLKWFYKYTPDLLVGHRSEVLTWLASEGIQAPRDIGFFTLNVDEASVPSAGLDLLPEAQGEAAVGAVVGQVLRFENAIQSRPQSILIEGAWREGPTLRAVSK